MEHIENIRKTESRFITHNLRRNQDLQPEKSKLLSPGKHHIYNNKVLVALPDSSQSLFVDFSWGLAVTLVQKLNLQSIAGLCRYVMKRLSSHLPQLALQNIGFAPVQARVAVRENSLPFASSIILPASIILIDVLVALLVSLTIISILVILTS